MDVSDLHGLLCVILENRCPEICKWLRVGFATPFLNLLIIISLELMYQIYLISDIYNMVHSSSKITVIKEQQSNFLLGSLQRGIRKSENHCFISFRERHVFYQGMGLWPFGL